MVTTVGQLTFEDTKFPGFHKFYKTLKMKLKDHLALRTTYLLLAHPKNYSQIFLTTLEILYS